MTLLADRQFLLPGKRRGSDDGQVGCLRALVLSLALYVRFSRAVALLAGDGLRWFGIVVLRERGAFGATTVATYALVINLPSEAVVGPSYPGLMSHLSWSAYHVRGISVR